MFFSYGRISEINLKGAYGFINFDDRRDASDAVRDIDGKSFNGGRYVLIESFAILCF